MCETAQKEQQTVKDIESRPVKTGKERIAAYDFIRAVCAMGIVIYHFSCSSNCGFQPLKNYANGEWGDIFVAIFFILSGAMLYKSHTEILSVRKFYFKRWRAIFPMFYLAYIYYYLQNVFAQGQWFYRGKPYLMLLTLLGMDGYGFYRFEDNYYLLGEWFLGAIIILYILYPFLLWLFQKSEPVLTGVVAAAYILMECIYEYTDWFRMGSNRNIISCLFCFVFGMLLIKHTKWQKQKGAAAGALLAGVFLCIVKVPVSKNTAGHAVGICLFIVLYFAGRSIMEKKKIGSVISGVSRLSYPIFLLHHQIIYQVQAFRNPAVPWKMMAVLLFTIGLTLWGSKILSLVTEMVMRNLKEY